MEIRPELLLISLASKDRADADTDPTRNASIVCHKNLKKKLKPKSTRRQKQPPSPPYLGALMDPIRDVPTAWTRMRVSFQIVSTSLSMDTSKTREGCVLRSMQATRNVRTVPSRKSKDILSTTTAKTIHRIQQVVASAASLNQSSSRDRYSVISTMCPL